MKKLIFLLALLFATTFINDGRDDPRDIFFFMDDTTGTSWEGELKGDLFYTDLNGTTQCWSKTSPVGLDLNGAEMVTKDSNSTFESGDTTDWRSNGTHSIDTSSTWKYAGSYAGKVIGMLGKELITNTVNGSTYAYDTFTINGDSITSAITDGSDYAGCASNNLGSITVGDAYKVSFNFVLNSGTAPRADLCHTQAGYAGSKSNTYSTIINGYNSFILTSTNSNSTSYLQIKNPIGEASNFAIYDITVERYNGDTTTNFISLAYTQFEPIVAGKKYTVELWLNADSTGTSLTTKPLVYGKLGSKTMWGTATDSISIYAGLFRKFAFTFLATSAEVNTPLKLYFSAARTYYMDNFSIREAYDFSKWVWIKSSATGTNKMIAERFASNNGLKLSINTSNQLVAVIGDGTNTVTKTGTATNLCNGSWHLVGLTASRTGNLQLYVDGATDGTATAITSLGSIVSTTTFQVGFLSEDYFNGSIGEIQRIRHTDLALVDKTPAQIYQRGKNRVHFYDSYTGGTIVGWWFSTATANDASGNGNNLTGTGSPSVSTLTTSY